MFSLATVRALWRDSVSWRVIGVRVLPGCPRGTTQADTQRHDTSESEERNNKRTGSGWFKRVQACSSVLPAATTERGVLPTLRANICKGEGNMGDRGHP